MTFWIRHTSIKKTFTLLLHLKNNDLRGVQKLIKILFLGLVVLLSGWFNPVKAAAINLSSDEELTTYETALDGRLSVAELSGLSPPENLLVLSGRASEKSGAWEKSVLKIDQTDDAVVLDPELVDSWAKLSSAPDAIRKSVNHLTTVSKWADEGIELTFEAIEDGAKIVSKNGDELGKLLKEGADDVLEISDDFIVDAASTASKKFDGVTIRSNTGEEFINAGFVKNADGTLGFVEDVSSYGSQLVQNTIKKRGALRKSMTAIKATEDAHHIIPVQLLKQNDVVKKAVEAGFEFNTTRNGLAIEKFVKATGKGRHGPHPKYTQQINEALERFRAQTPNYTNQQAKEFLEIITDDIKNTIQTTSGKINDLSLGL